MIIHLLITDWFKGLLPADTPTHADLYKNLFASVVPDAEYRVYAAMEGELPDLTDPEPGLYVITGSQAGAYETDAWIGTLLQWIRDAKEAGIALSGVCFGAQAIGEALGGRVIKNPNGWGLGLRESRVVSDRLRKYLPSDTLLLAVNHGDQVVELPPDAELLATSDFCANDAFAIGDKILAFQGHPEFTIAYLEFFLTVGVKGQSPEFVEKVRESLKLGKPQGELIARMMVDSAKA